MNEVAKDHIGKRAHAEWTLQDVRFSRWGKREAHHDGRKNSCCSRRDQDAFLKKCVHLRARSVDYLLLLLLLVLLAEATGAFALDAT